MKLDSFPPLKTKDMKTVKVKPLSVNEAWQGRRYKSPKYKVFEKEVLLKLPDIKLPEPKFYVVYDVGYSNQQSDIDNFVKPFQDCLQKKYGFNDSDIYALLIRKNVVPKGEEFIRFEFIHIEIVEGEDKIKKPQIDEASH